MKSKIIILSLILVLTGTTYYYFHDRARSRYIVTTSECSAKEYTKYNGNLVILKFDELPYNTGRTEVSPREFNDDNGIPLFDRRGKLTYHPVYMIQQALPLLDAYNSTKKIEYLNRAKNIAHKLESLSMTINSSLFVSYSFDFSLHGSDVDTFSAPWYSGMAQGELLSLFIRLYEITNEKHYLEISQKTFNSLSLSHHNTTEKPWVSCVDDNNNLWIEEYPQNPPAYTLNGMIFATFGVYDFYRITKSSEAEDMLRGTIQTIKDNINKYRIIGDISHYCLRHPNVQRIHYHNTHAEQLKHLYDMTGDDFFLEMSNNFIKDTEHLTQD